MNSDTFLKLFQYEKIEGIIKEPIKEIVIDSRKVTNGSAFVCVDGFTVDGHEFVEQAIEKGASVIIAEKEIESAIPVIYVRNTKLTLQRLAPLFYQMPSQQLKMIGVTGTNGKTTVAHMIHQYLTKLHEKSAVIGTIGFQLENQLFETDNTTPNVLDTQKLLHQAVVSDADTVTMEVSSHGLIEGRLAGVNFDIAIFTNLSHDHLDFHGTMEHYGYAKGLLFAQLGQDLTQDKAVILNADDVWSNRYRQMSPFPFQTYGFSNEADFRIEIVQKAIEQTTFFLHGNNTTYSLSTHLLGAYNLSNLIAATLAVVAKGYPLEEVLALLPEIDAPK
ncbi:MAG TPA: UDP-N-acetylmuramoyl-L-alanyl-D-glutamate--2,6-diaminopimelate ligase, partial [Savagea sp.]